jgi:hypothetical protein
MFAKNLNPEECTEEGPQSALERKLIEEYLSEKGYHLSDLQALPERDARRLMREACRYASLKLAEVESRAQLRKEIHYSE